MKTIGHVGISTKEEIDSAVKAAEDAFEDWRETPVVTRCRYLFRLRELLEENFEELSRVQTQEHGKCIDESRGETRRGIENVEVACGMPTLMMGDSLEDIASGIDEYLIRQPFGSFRRYRPLSTFPFMIPLWSAPLCRGHRATRSSLNPPAKCPSARRKITELVEEAGFPPGVWNMVHGGRTVVGGMLEHPDIQGITFVGSTPVMRDVIYPGLRQYGQTVYCPGGGRQYSGHYARLQCGRHHSRGLMTSFFGNAGQRCLAGQTLVIVGEDDNFYNEFMAKVTETTKNIRVGYGLDESVQMGPVRDAKKEGKHPQLD